MIHQEQRFRRFAIITICGVYLLIAVGSIVRVTGSGMGCPDWPTCFGRMIPPTDVSQLPSDYKTRFAVQGREIADFNVVHTWTEYINRLIGVSIGLLIIATVVMSLHFWKTDRRITLNAAIALLLVMIEGWLGAKVVEHDLRPLTVTLHFVLALFIVLALTNAIVYSHYSLWKDDVMAKSSRLRAWMIGALLILLIQIVLGTQVREQVDQVSRSLNFLQRDAWLSTVGTTFYLHRTFSLVVLAIQFVMLRELYRAGRLNAPVISWIIAVVVLLLLETLSGVVMAYFHLPVVIQPVHIVLSALIFGIEYMLLHRVRVARADSDVSLPLST